MKNTFRAVCIIYCCLNLCKRLGVDKSYQDASSHIEICWGHCGCNKDLKKTGRRAVCCKYWLITMRSLEITNYFIIIFKCRICFIWIITVIITLLPLEIMNWIVVWVELYAPKRYAEMLNSSAAECNFIWK